MANVGMFNIPNFLGGSSVGASKGLQAAGLGGSSGGLVPVSPFGGGDPQAKQIGATGAGITGGPTGADPCVQSLLTTGQPTPCPPGQQHDPIGSCGPCISIPMPGDPTAVGVDPGQNQLLTAMPSSCPEPTSPSPGKPGSHNWNTSTCTWESVAQVIPNIVGPKGGLTDEQMTIRDIVGGKLQYGRNRGAVSRQELGQFGRAGGGVGGGSMSDLETFDNPLLAGGSPYLGKNVSQFAYGGKMRDTYNYGGKMENPYTTYPDGGRADFMSGVRQGMNSAVAAGQIDEVIKNNSSRRRFISGGKF
tara:strand:- start:884 stop:1792 length:909 start_codon:yes stop_codon:yes gene_type:complete